MSWSSAEVFSYWCFLFHYLPPHSKCFADVDAIVRLGALFVFLLHTVNAVLVLDEVRVDTLKSSPGSRHRHKRKGRGISAGQGASCGFGMRGQKSRSGPGVRAGFEGGQTALYRRLPKLVGRPMGPGHTKKVSRCMLTEAESGVGVDDRVPSAWRNVCCVSQTVQRFGTHIIACNCGKMPKIAFWRNAGARATSVGPKYWRCY